MEVFDQIRRISFVFFIIVGLAHFVSGLMFVNGYGVPGSGLVNRVLFIPFIIATLSYGLSNLKYNLSEYGKKFKNSGLRFYNFRRADIFNPNIN